ncbi:MAG: hypothetical protein GY754_36525 [bacterium]|nr:hypothetical protein [bacterium]
MKIIDPKEFGLPSRTMIVSLGKNHIGIVKDRKSRIIMKDGEKLLELAEQIRSSNPGLKVSILTTAPVCSKTTAFLKEQGIAVKDLPEK